MSDAVSVPSVPRPSLVLLGGDAAACEGDACAVPALYSGSVTSATVAPKAATSASESTNSE